MNRKIRRMLAVSVAVGLALTACRSATAPRYPSEREDDDADPNEPDPGQAMIEPVIDLDFGEDPMVV